MRTLFQATCWGTSFLARAYFDTADKTRMSDFLKNRKIIKKLSAKLQNNHEY